MCVCVCSYVRVGAVRLHLYESGCSRSCCLKGYCSALGLWVALAVGASQLSEVRYMDGNPGDAEGIAQRLQCRKQLLDKMAVAV